MPLIRPVKQQDRDGIRDLYLRAFPEDERQTVARLAVELLDGQTSPPTIALVAEVRGVVVGHVAFSPLGTGSRPQWQGYILAPLAVVPAHQGHRVGSKLVADGIARLSGNGVDVLFVYGDPNYYGRFGFKSESAVNYQPLYPLQQPGGWQALVLNGDDPVERVVELSCVAPLRNPALW